MSSRPPASRLAFIDQIRGCVTLLVVLHHTAITYGGAGGWYYKEAPVPGSGGGIAAPLLTLMCAVDQAWFMGAFFLLAGYHTPGSFDRKGTARYFAERAIRLGIPLLVYTLFLDTLTNAIAGVGRGAHFHLVDRILEFQYRPGPLWFVQSLLIFSMGYALWRHFRPTAPALDDAPLPPHRALLWAALGTGAAAFLIRLVIPVGQELGRMQLGFYASYVVLFAAGCAAARHRWLERIDKPYMVVWWRIALVALPILPIAAVAYRAITGSSMHAEGGPTGAALLYAMWEPFVAWGVILALLWYFRTRVSPDRLRGLGRRAYAIYCFHPPVVVGVSVALRDWAAPPLLKFAAVGSLSCALLYVLCGLLLRIPLVARVW